MILRFVLGLALLALASFSFLAAQPPDSLREPMRTWLHGSHR